MGQSYIARIWLILSGLFIISTGASAQTPLTELSIAYNKPYQFQSAYSVIYDNMSQPATLKDFKITFYDPSGVKVGETPVERYPLTGQTVNYSLAQPVIGFQSVKFVVLSLHDGDIAGFPKSANAFLALNEMSEYAPPAPVEVQPVEPKPSEPTSTEPTSIEPKAKATQSMPAAAVVTPTIPDDILANIGGLNAAIGSLATRLETAKQNRAKTSLDTATLNPLETRLAALQADISNIQSRITAVDVDIAGMDINALRQDATALNTQSQTLGADITTLEAETSARLAANAGDPKGPVAEPPSMSPFVMAALAIGAALLALGAWFVIKARVGYGRAGRSRIGQGEAGQVMSGHSSGRSNRPPRPQTIAPAGVLFSASPLVAASPVPLTASGTLAASQVAMLTGSYAVLRPAYAATGRLGFAQDGKPSRDDYSLGTGFLITDRHVMTNRHVHGLYGQYLTGEHAGGIEFIAEKDNDASDFVRFNGDAPFLVPDMDIAIYTLSEPVKNRTPIVIKPIDTEVLLARDIVVIGYPDTHAPDDPRLSKLVEDAPIFAVKRISQGQVFRHSTDTDCPLGIDVKVSETDSREFLMPAICHNASTMGGNSGSPILDSKTGQLLGVHFAGHKVFNAGEAANLAMAVEYLNGAYKEIDVNISSA